MKILPLSKSTYGDFQKCPQYAYNRKVKGIQPPAGMAAIKGNQFHNAISQILKGDTEESARSRVTFPEVHEWLTLAMHNKPMGKYKKAFSEAKILATRNLDIVNNGGDADLIGIFDLVWFDDVAQSLYILDWKTGRYENDSEIERHLYAALGKALHPQAKSVFFELYFVQTNRSLISTYSWASKDRTMVIKPPHGEVNVLRDKNINPMVLWVSDIIDEVESSEGEPTPGPQCRNWYGSECFYLREHCPAYSNGRKIRNAKMS